MKRWFVLLLAVAGCSDLSPTAPEAFSRIPCRPPANLVSMVTGPAFAPAAMRSALLHATNPMSVALGTDADVRSLQNAINGVVANIGASDNDGACRLLSIAAALLDGLPDTAATLPNRDGIRLIFAVTAQSLAVALGQ
jgi:hypothetical protein